MTNPISSRLRLVVAALCVSGALGASAAPAVAQSSVQDQCTEAELDPQFQGQGLCSDSPPPAATPEPSAPQLLLGGLPLLGGLFR